MTEGFGGARDYAVSADADRATHEPSRAVSAVPVSIADVQRFDGEFMVFRLMAGTKLSKRIGGTNMPYFRHPTLDSAEAEARRLSGQFPESTFLIMRAVSRVKVLP